MLVATQNKLHAVTIAQAGMTFLSIYGFDSISTVMLYYQTLNELRWSKIF